MPKKETPTEPLELVACPDCGEVKDKEIFHNVRRGHDVCESCFEEYGACDDCGDYYPKDDMYTVRGGNQVCSECIDNEYRSCDECGDFVRGGDIGNNGRCDQCGGDMDYRGYTKDAKLLKGKAGDIVKSTRPFGIELEMQFGTDKDMADACSNMPECIGIEEDGSINDIGVEIQTPPASGDKAEKLIKEVCKIADDGGASVDDSCGYHLHIDYSDLGDMTESNRAYTKRSIFMFYYIFEDVLLSFLPDSRRDNDYCMQLTHDYTLKELYNVDTEEDIEKIWYRASDMETVNRRKNYKKDDSRYRGINMHTLLSANHLEVRYHSGTVNAKKVLEWANLHTAIADILTNDRYTSTSTLYGHRNISDINRKTAIMFDMLNLSEDSRQYWLARQKKFRGAEATVDKKATKIVDDLLAQENE